MEINVNVTIHAASSLAAVFAGFLSGQHLAAPDAGAQLLEEEKPSGKKGRKGKGETVEPEAPKEETKTYSIEDLQAICAEKVDANEANRAKIKAILVDDYDVTKLGNLPEEHHAEFVKKVKALK